MDSGYRGEVKAILINLSDEDFVINKGDRIAQFMVMPIIRPEFVVLSREDVSAIEGDERGVSGFGSSGIN